MSGTGKSGTGTSGTGDVAGMTFEQAMAELEKVVGQLESGQVALETSIELFERGRVLKAHCEAKLKAAEEKVAQITLGEDGQPKGTRVVEGL
jgi:exodeoxyribonuclease VII small subunit